jgi:hypothetical protein
MSQPPGKCVFCGGKRLTKGHVWPDWLNDILPQTATHHEHEIGRFETFIPKAKGPAYSKRLRQGHARSRKPRNTCLRCNTGWMSGIEGLAKQSLLPLIKGENCVLDTFAQFSISTLLCLIAMRIEFLSGMRAITAEDHDWVRYYREPSKDWKIWIAHFDGDTPDDHPARSYCVQLVSDQTETVGPEYCNAQISTLVIGKLCAHLVYAPELPLTKFEYEGIRLTRIWPANPYHIDTGWMTGLSGRDVLWLHETFARDSPTLPTAGTGDPPPTLQDEEAGVR